MEKYQNTYGQLEKIKDIVDQKYIFDSIPSRREM